MSEANTVAEISPDLWRLKEEAEAEVKRLGIEYSQASFGTHERSRLRKELGKAEQRLQTELDLIRQAVVPGFQRESPPVRARNEQAMLVETGLRILTDYAAKLDRIVDSALNASLSAGTREASVHGIDRLILDCLGSEFRAISEPLRWWITKLSAVHEEGWLTEPRRMELRLRLSELESKFQTAGRLLKKLGVL